jgi:hypothetical protein
MADEAEDVPGSRQAGGMAKVAESLLFIALAGVLTIAM